MGAGRSLFDSYLEVFFTDPLAAHIGFTMWSPPSHNSRKRLSSCELLRPIPVGPISQTAPCMRDLKNGLKINCQPFKSSVRRGKPQVRWRSEFNSLSLYSVTLKEQHQQQQQHRQTFGNYDGEQCMYRWTKDGLRLRSCRWWCYMASPKLS